MPSLVYRRSNAMPSPQGLGAEPEALAQEAPPIFLPEMVPRNCRLKHYDKVNVPATDIDGEVIAYCSPDSTYAVTKRLFDNARKSILIGIYDFSANHVTELVQDALRRGVTIQLMLDIDNDKEQTLFDELVESGVDGVPAPSCASQRARFFSSSHEKVIVIDGEWCLVQSGNYSDNSIPLNVKDGGDPYHFRPGNRDTGLAIQSKKLAKFFTKILESDIALELTGPEGLAAAIKAANVFLVERAPTKIPDKLFPSKSFSLTQPLEVQPVLSPDNYMDVIPGKLSAARKSILIEQQYIRGSQENISDLLAAIKAARDTADDFDIRIILGKIFNSSDLPKEEENLELLESEYGLKLGKNIRYVDTTRFVHCHNKMVLVDGTGVLISSQNWSNSAVSKNREAGVWLNHRGICSYFTRIFENDWKTAFKSPATTAADVVEPEALQRGGFIRVAAADYKEV
jgi:phosphatidylserine/phosphatidylglycerophosphate/cardiolipin synthase-like enzyme